MQKKTRNAIIFVVAAAAISGAAAYFLSGNELVQMVPGGIFSVMVLIWLMVAASMLRL